jgi:hypothetical protein
MTTKEEFEKMWNERKINRIAWLISLTTGGSVFADNVQFGDSLVTVHYKGYETAYLLYSTILEVL